MVQRMQRNLALIILGMVWGTSTRQNFGKSSKKGDSFVCEHWRAMGLRLAVWQS